MDGIMDGDKIASAINGAPGICIDVCCFSDGLAYSLNELVNGKRKK